MPGRRWTGAEDRLLCRLVRDERCTYAEAGAELGRTERAARNRYRRLGSPRNPGGRPADVYRRAELLDLVGKGLTLNRAAAVMRVRPSTTCRMARQLAAVGLLVRRGERTAARYEVAP